MAVGLQREPWKKNKQYHADASTPTLKVSSGAPRRRLFGKPYVAVTPPREACSDGCGTSRPSPRGTYSSDCQMLDP